MATKERAWEAWWAELTDMWSEDAIARCLYDEFKLAFLAGWNARKQVDAEIARCIPDDRVGDGLVMVDQIAAAIERED